MNFDLKKSKTTDAETLEHCLTVVYCFFETAADYGHAGNHKRGVKEWKKGGKYMRDYICELFKQNL